jgi:hypothetical protein
MEQDPDDQIKAVWRRTWKYSFKTVGALMWPYEKGIPPYQDEDYDWWKDEDNVATAKASAIAQLTEGDLALLSSRHSPVFDNVYEITCQIVNDMWLVLNKLIYYGISFVPSSTIHKITNYGVSERELTWPGVPSGNPTETLASEPIYMGAGAYGFYQCIPGQPYSCWGFDGEGWTFQSWNNSVTTVRYYVNNPTVDTMFKCGVATGVVKHKGQVKFTGKVDWSQSSNWWHKICFANLIVNGVEVDTHEGTITTDWFDMQYYVRGDEYLFETEFSCNDPKDACSAPPSGEWWEHWASDLPIDDWYWHDQCSTVLYAQAQVQMLVIKPLLSINLFAIPLGCNPQLPKA